MAHKHEIDPVEIERQAARRCDDAATHTIAAAAKDIYVTLREMHDPVRKANAFKMAVRMILRGSNIDLSWPQCESALHRLYVAATQNETL